MMARDHILVTVKTYPELSTTYGETVCTAGMRMERVGSVVVGLTLLAVVMPGPAMGQGCSFAMALGVAVPTGGVPDPGRGEVKLSAGQTGRLGLECGSKSIRFGVDLESTALGSQSAATFGYGVSLLGLVGRFGVDFPLTDDDNAPWVGVGGHAGFIVPDERARSLLAILHLERQVDFGRLGKVAGGSVRFGVPLSPPWAVIFDVAVRANTLSTIEPGAKGTAAYRGHERLMTFPVSVGVRLSL